MSNLKNYVETKEYIVTLKDKNDLENFYNDMESLRTAKITIPNREVVCIDRRNSSRSTHYLLTKWEANELKNDPRVKKVELHPKYLGVSADVFASTKTQTSDFWNKSGSTSNTHLNYSLLRCYEGVNRAGWGSDGTNNQSGTIKLDATGKNVDVVIVDDDGLVSGHPEYAVNADGTGGSRYIEYNWFQHDPVVKGTAAGNYNYGTGSHSTHVAGTVAGTTQGWARDANIYNIYYYAGAVGNVNFPYVMDYVREFHRTKEVNLETGRKNPTITNNSWGMSIFPSEWALTDITAVTYRGVRYTPESSGPSFNGYSGVCDSNSRLATLLGFENFGNRITTAGPYNPPGGDILTKPISWSQEGNQTYLTNFDPPEQTYTVTVQGPGTLTLINNVAAESFTGNLTLSSSIVIKEGDTVLESYSQGPFTTPEGGSTETNIRETFVLTDLVEYTIEFTTDLDLSNAGSPVIAVAMSLTISDGGTDTPTATVTEITNQLLGAGTLTVSTAPTSGNNDDGFWQINLDFPISYLGNAYNAVYVGTNTYLTFTAGSNAYISLGPSTPNLPKIMWSCEDNSVQRIYYGAEGVAPNRTYRIRVEGTASTGGTIGSPNMVCEYVFYEATPNQIDLQTGVNGRKVTSSGSFSTEQLNTWGFISGQRIPKRVAALDADIEDAISEGILYVGAAGNGRWKHSLPGEADWNNTFEMANRYPDSVTEPYYYMRGTSPTANDTTDHPDGDFEIPNICVGSIDVTTGDYKATYSDCGVGVDIWAPGTNIISSYTGGVSDSRNGSYSVGKLSGTSMASPQVCGVLACALESNPHWNQRQAKQYITSIAKQNQITATTGGPADVRDLQGAPNLFLYYKRTRADTGVTVPKNDQGARPSSGMAWPRPKIYRFGNT
jgi:hypothetical protein